MWLSYKFTVCSCLAYLKFNHPTRKQHLTCRNYLQSVQPNDTVCSVFTWSVLNYVLMTYLLSDYIEKYTNKCTIIWTFMIYLGFNIMFILQQCNNYKVDQKITCHWLMSVVSRQLKIFVLQRIITWELFGFRNRQLFHLLSPFLKIFFAE